jgi:hypothetical protein
MQCPCITCHKNGLDRDSPCTYKWGKNTGKKGSNEIHVLRVEDKGPITVVVYSVIDGSSLPLEVNFIGSTIRYLPQNGLRKASCLGTRFHLTYFTNHWSTLETCQQFVEKILIPYHKNKVQEMNLPQNQKMIWLIDFWSVHKNMDFIQWIKSQHPQVCLMFIFANCTSKLYLADVIIQRPFKHAFKK